MSDEVENTEEDQVELSSEDIARERGWKSRDDWKGDIPDNFVDDPDEFNERYEKSNPNLVRQNKELIERLDRTERIFKDHLDALERNAAREKEEAVRAVEQRLADAVKLGDQRAAAEAVNERDQLRAQPAQQQSSDSAFDNWVNSPDAAWYRDNINNPDSDEIIYAMRLNRQMRDSGVTPENNPNFYADVSRKVQQKFSKDALKTTPSVETGRQTANPKPKPKVTKWADLPASVKNDREYNRMVKALYGGDKDKFAANYAKNEG